MTLALQPLSAINNVFERLACGEVPSRVVLDFAPGKSGTPQPEAWNEVVKSRVMTSAR